jgi:hypothetical protein
MTSSARWRNDSEIVIPSALAVLRFTNSSNLVGCSTGKSPGLAPLASAGADKVFAEKVSGAQTYRKQLAKAIDALGADDVLLVTRLDRLACSTRDLLNVLDTVSKKRAGFRSIADTWASPSHRSLPPFIRPSISGSPML